MLSQNVRHWDIPYLLAYALHYVCQSTPMRLICCSIPTKMSMNLPKRSKEPIDKATSQDSAPQSEEGPILKHV